MKPDFQLIVLAALLIGCGGTHAKNRLLIDPEVGTDDPLVQIDLAEDTRRGGAHLDVLANRTDKSVRRRVAVALGRIGNPAGADTLARLLFDPEPVVRDAAAFSAGLLGSQATTALKTALMDRLGRETRPGGLAALAWAIGLVGGADEVGPLGALLDHRSAECRAGGLKGLAALFERGRPPVPAPLLLKVVRLLADDAPTVRLMSAFALAGMRPGTGDPDTLMTTLAKTADTDPDPEVRVHAIRALAARGGLDRPVLERALKSIDYRVAAAAIVAVQRLETGARCALASAALTWVSDILEADPDPVSAGPGQIVRGALEAAAGCTATGEIRDRAEWIARRLEASKDGPANQILCLARLLAGRNRLTLLTCDPDHPETGKKMLLARLHRASSTTDADLKIIKEMTDDPDSSVAATAIRVLGRVDRPEASRALLTLLEDQRTLVVTAALETIAASPDPFRPRPGGDSHHEALMQALARVVDRFLVFSHTHGPILAVIRVLKALGQPDAAPILGTVARDPRPMIRYAALDATRTIRGLTPPTGLAPLAPARPVDHRTLDSLRRSQPRALITTERGAIAVALRGDLAPAAVHSFVGLAATGYYDGTRVHRAIPGALIQTGDPTGTGLGDPGYSVRSSESPIPFAAGTVGLARSGKDTEGGQFFITLVREPALDGKYTVIGQVTDRMGLLDRLLEGDKVLDIVATME